MKLLLIDTSSNKEIKVGLKINGEEYWLRKNVSFQKAQVVLELVDEILKKHTLGLNDIEKITVATGPGSFTGLRVGAAVANTLGWALGIAVNGKKQIVKPLYH